MEKVVAVSLFSGGVKKKKGQRKIDNRNYQHDNRQTSSGSGVPNNANHYERWKKPASGSSIIVPCYGKLCVTFVQCAN